MVQECDYLLVVKTEILFDTKNENKLDYLRQYIKSLQIFGMRVKVLKDASSKELVFISIYLPQIALSHFAELYEVDIFNIGQRYLPYGYTLPNFLQTHVSDSKYRFKREGAAASWERCYITLEMLKDAKSDENLHGIDRLIKMGIVQTGFSLHDGDFTFDPNADPSNLNDRQLLAKYWANFGCWYKEQPLNLIQKYYGNEVAFYFAWLGFYNKMLIPAALAGFLCFLCGIINMSMQSHYRIDEICDSDLKMCGVCHTHDHCVFNSISTYCLSAKITFLCDNTSTVAFGVFMSFWATIFLNRWKTYENILKLRWNSNINEVDTRILHEYTMNARQQRHSNFSGQMEPYQARCWTYFYATVTYAFCILLVAVVTTIIILVTVYRFTISSVTRIKDLAQIGADITVLSLILSAIIQGLLIKFFSFFYSPLSIWLTRMENPRTQSEFQNSVIYKNFVLAFATNYGSLFYIAFLKGNFYWPNQVPSFLSLENDICGPSGCVMDLCIQLGFLLLVQSLSGNFLTMLNPFIRRIKYLFVRQPFKSDQKATIVELEYNLHSTDCFTIGNEFMQMVVQYGFVTFFVAAFPLAPLFALANNIVEMRTDAIKFVKRRRRYVSRRQSGIGTWNGLLQALTYFSIATNAFVIAFTTDFVVRQAYSIQFGSIKGYLMSSLSVFALEQETAKIARSVGYNSSVCYYSARRFPPGHPNEYKLTTEFWYQMVIRIVGVIVFEHLLLGLNAGLSWILPDVPMQVKEMLHFHCTEERNMRLALGQEAKKKMRSREIKLN